MKVSLNKEYRTKAGQPVRILCVDKPGRGQPVVALINGNGAPVTYYLDGVYNHDHNPSDKDLIEIRPFMEFEFDKMSSDTLVKLHEYVGELLEESLAPK